MFVKFKIHWQDGLYQYCPGKVVDLPTDLALRYIDSGKAVEADPPKWAMEQTGVKAKKKIPSARMRIRKISSTNKTKQSLSDMANELMED